jgi:hypothetical protein
VIDEKPRRSSSSTRTAAMAWISSRLFKNLKTIKRWLIQVAISADDSMELPSIRPDFLCQTVVDAQVSAIEAELHQ